MCLWFEKKNIASKIVNRFFIKKEIAIIFLFICRDKALPCPYYNKKRTADYSVIVKIVKASCFAKSNHTLCKTSLNKNNKYI